MEKMLLKMARQLNAMDEASLMALWNKYMQRVQNFDASREWEEAAEPPLSTTLSSMKFWEYLRVPLPMKLKERTKN